MKRLFVLILLAVGCCNPAISQKNGGGQVKTVVIDAGHGGDKPGAVGKKSKEKDLTLAMALRLGRLIEDSYDDVTVIYTRKTDVDVSLSERARMANRAKADLFISIHCNSWATSTPTGVETYVMGLSQSKANLEVAKKENADILLEKDYKSNSDYQGFDPNSPESYVMFAMYQNAYLDRSLDFAGYIQNQYKGAIKTINRGVKQAEIFVLYKTAMPAVLTEVGFISNPEEERYMMSEAGQATIVNCIFRAFASYKAALEGTKVATAKVKDSGSRKAPEPVEAQDTSAIVSSQDSSQSTVHSSPNPTFIPSTAQTGVNPPLPKPEPVDNSAEQDTVAAPQDSPAAAPQANPAPAAAQVLYKVQFMTSGKELKAGAREFKGLTSYEYYKQRDTYCYTTGSFTSLGEAVKLQKQIREQGFKDAFIVAFCDGQRITLQKARELTQR